MKRKSLIKRPLRHEMTKLLALLFAFIVYCGTAYSQNQVVTGTVKGADGSPLIGVNVVITGTSTGVVTDMDGKYSIKVPSSESELKFSYVGYEAQTIKVGNQTVIDVVLKEQVKALDEIVVVGYGVQKKKLVTGSDVNVDGSDIQKLNTNTAMDALKGVTPGVDITQNNGQPGSGTKVYIRGIGTIGNASPLYIVDGVEVGNIDFLSPSDIQSMNVLKDAASSAIYGSRGANGVILITTKKGSLNNKASISYDAYYGWQNVLKKPGLLNAQQYVQIMSEASTNSGYAPIDFSKETPDWNRIQSGAWKGTNWFDAITNKNAPIQSHSLTITGGNEKSSYSFGASYLNQLGILGKQANADYKRLNLRLGSTHVLYEKHGHDVLTFSENLIYSNFKTPTVRTGNIYWSDIHNMMVADPMLPIYDSTGNYHYAIPWNTSEANPIALMEYNDKYNYNNNNTIVGSAYLELQPVKNLRIRSTVGVNSWFGSYRQFIPVYNLSTIDFTTRAQVNQGMNSGYTWTSTNTATYTLTKGSHNFTFLLGQEATKNAHSRTLSGHNEDSSAVADAEHAYLDNIKTINSSYTILNGKDDYGWGMLSYFGRVSYSYKDKYLLTVVYRADGSSNFAKGHRWGHFPSVSAGWVVTDESFLQGTSNWLSFWKIRGSWGQNGNQDIPNFQYLATISTDQANYFFGPDKTIRTVGSYAPILPNPEVSWETSEQTDLGTDVNFLNNKLQFTFDWYNKTTKNWLVQAPALTEWGTGAPYINGGTIKNKGVETSLRWNQIMGDFSYGINASFSYNKNEVTAIDNSEKIIHGPANVLSQGTSEMFRAQVGYPVGYFWGYKTDGIMQNGTDTANYVGPTGKQYFPGKQHPGDIRFVDVNHNGIINDSDKVMIGNPQPKFIFGFQIHVGYKGFSLEATANGMAGYQIAKSYRSFADSWRQNYTTDIFGRWHGEGTSNKIPRVIAGVDRNTQYISDLYIQNGNFLRISNVTIGYDFKKLFKKLPLQEARLYVTGQNLHIFTKYTGMDPEVGYGPTNNTDPTQNFPWARNIDLGYYPAPKVYMVGLNVKF